MEERPNFLVDTDDDDDRQDASLDQRAPSITRPIKVDSIQKKKLLLRRPTQQTQDITHPAAIARPAVMSPDTDLVPNGQHMTFEERTLAYEEARRRIFGTSAGFEDSAPPSPPCAKASLRVPFTVGQPRPPSLPSCCRYNSVPAAAERGAPMMSAAAPEYGGYPLAQVPYPPITPATVGGQNPVSPLYCVYPPHQTPTFVNPKSFGFPNGGYRSPTHFLSSVEPPSQDRRQCPPAHSSKSTSDQSSSVRNANVPLASYDAEFPPLGL